MSTPFSPTPEQQEFFRAVAETSGSYILEACAGSGKTTTILEALRVLPVRDPDALLPPSTLFLAFNKSIADTLAARVPRHVQCSTFHSLGFRALRSSGLLRRDVKVESRKVSRLVFNALGDSPDVRPVCTLVSLAKGIWPTAGLDWEALARAHELPFEEKRAALRVAQKVLEDSSADLAQIDFDDMLYLAVRLGAHFEPQDYVFVDECQDTNDIQLEILDRLRQPGEYVQFSGMSIPEQQHSPSRFFFVGDRHQAIYGFRGANADSMDRISSRFGCLPLPLSVSFRCSQAVVAEAQKVLKQTT